MDKKLLGERIKAARQRQNMSQEQLAAAIGKDKRALHEYELGERKIWATDLPALAAALNVNLLYFFDGEFGNDELDQTLLKEFHQLPSVETKHLLVGIARLLRQQDPGLPPELE